MSKASVEIPLSIIIFIVILIIVAVLILLWHLGGFETFKGIMKNTSCGTIENASGGGFTIC